MAISEKTTVETKFVEDESSATYVDYPDSIFHGCQDRSVSHWGDYTMTTRWLGVDSRSGEVTHPELGAVAILTEIRCPNGVTGLAWAPTHPVSQNWDICSDYLINKQELAEQAQEEYEDQQSLQRDRSALNAIKAKYRGTHLTAYLKRAGREDLLYLV
jgi:hypothetical protein